jgi:hypothetical protein
MSDQNEIIYTDAELVSTGRRIQKERRQSKLAATPCSAARRLVGTLGELRDFLRPFTDECPLTYDDGRPCYIAYKMDGDGNGKTFVGIVRQNEKS